MTIQFYYRIRPWSSHKSLNVTSIDMTSDEEPFITWDLHIILGTSESF